jgi:hypothetical protein
MMPGYNAWSCEVPEGFNQLLEKLRIEKKN